ncbi:hypothetical protein HPB50_010474 [Hyalomma asiaticum]|uniref:Uncharacterized protein n=1 Tax=Hyalomma asiaticum TaxID=266040 RepID=A0ACB7TIB2_HYAAI|nr:hypothetical protein HPB50_010474 [Hyalomma asiaticum]
MVLERRPGHRPQNSWWDREVEVAWKERRHTNREHRRTVKGLDTEVCAEKWAVYLDQTHNVQALVQCKIADYNLRLIQSIRQEGRSAAHKFWTYVRSLDRAAPPPPPLIDAATGQPVTEPATGHLEEVKEVARTGLAAKIAPTDPAATLRGKSPLSSSGHREFCARATFRRRVYSPTLSRPHPSTIRTLQPGPVPV